MKNVKKKMDICFDSRAPSIVVEVDAYRKGYEDIKRRGGKIRAFSEITADNIHYFKELMNLVDELRHLDAMKGGIAVSETECMAATVLQEATPLTQVIYSNRREVVEQMQYIFDILWYRAIPARQRIREIEEGIKREFIETIQNEFVGSLLIPAVYRWLKSKRQTSRLNSLRHKILLHGGGNIDHLNMSLNETTNAYFEGKISNEQYTNLKTEISIFFQEIFKKRIDSSDGNETLLKEVKEDVEDAYAEEKISEKHYKLLIEKISDSANSAENQPENKLSSQESRPKMQGSPIKS
jgi:hypothetical protein